MKRIFSALLIAIMLVTALPFAAFPASAATSGNLTYTISDGKATITDCNTSASGALEIPATLGGYPVTAIGDHAFNGCTGLTSISIPNSITTIGKSAFNGCTGIVSVHISDVAAWCKISFATYSSNPLFFAQKLYLNDTLVTELMIPDGVTAIGNYAFRNYSALTSITIPEGVTSIGDYAFTGCGLTSIFLPNSITTIGNYAFAACTGITSVTIPRGVTSIGGFTFSGCSGLTSIIISDGVTSINAWAFYGCDGLTSITIPNSVTSIGTQAFEYCHELKNVYITDIEAWCKISFDPYHSNPLYYAKKLYLNNTLVTELMIPEGVTSIGDYAFTGCGLNSIFLPNSITTIGDYAFNGCTGLTSISIPNSITSIGSSAFYDTAYYNNASNWKNDVLYIGNHLIQATPSLAGDYSIIEGTRCIAGNAFLGCSDLTSITIPDSVTTIGDSAFYNCDNLTSVTIPDSVTSIGSYAFFNCFGLKTVFYAGSSKSAISIEDNNSSLTSAKWIYNSFSDGLWGYSLYDNKATITGYADTLHESITIPTALGGYPVTSIGNSAFYDYDSLTSVTIPDSVTSIGYDAFWSCDSLTSVTIGNGVAFIGNYAFDGCSSLEKVTITDLAAWCKINFGNLFSNPLLYGELYLNGNPVTALVIPDGVPSISDYAFYNCDSLTSITIPDNVTTIGSYAFWNCDSLTSVIIGNGVTTIGSSAFGYCDNLTSVTIGNGVTSIGSYAFEDCGSLTSVTIPDSVTSIGSSAFRYCESLTSITIGNGVTTIGNYAFSYCDSLTSVTIPDSVTSIGSYTFFNCDSLTSVTIGNGVTSIGDYAFDNLTDVWYRGSASQKASISMGYYTGLTVTTWHYNTCKADDHIYSADCDTTCENCDWPRTATVPHDYQGQHNKQQHYQKCSVCKVETGFEDHSFDHACDTTCNDNCGYVRTITHDYKVQYNGQQHYQECSGCKEKINFEDHRFDHACDTTCNGGCGYVRTITHDYKVQYNGQQHYQKCSVCKVETGFEDHSFDHACDTTCNDGCGYVRTTTHDYQVKYNGQQHYQECSGCKEKINFEDHSFDHACDTTCNGGCGYVRTITHDYKVQYNGQQHYQKCSVCKVETGFEDHSFDHVCDTTCNGGCGYVRAPEHKLFHLTENINYLLSLQNSATDPFSYSNGVYTSTNKANDSSSIFTIEALYDCTLTIEYSVSSEKSYDKLTIAKGSTTLATVSGTVSEKTLSVPMKAGDLVTLKYSKDSSQASGTDSASFKVTAEGSAYVPAEEVAHFCHLPLYCDLCGEVAVEAKDHTFTRNGGHTCEECGFSRVSSAPTVEHKDSGVVRLTAIEGFEYSKDGTNWQDSNEFSHLSAEQTYCFYQRVKETQTVTAGEVSEPLVLTLKAYQDPPAAPIVITFTDTVIQLLPAAGCEYSIDGRTWTSSPLFEGLSPAVKYTLYQRYPETAEAEASVASTALCTTDKSTQAAPSSAPTLAQFTANSITLTAIDGYEYSRDGINWQTSPTFTNLSCGRTYLFYQRVAATSTHYASKSSPSAQFKTDKGTQAAPNAPVLVQKTHDTVVLQAQSGCEYSYDTIHWQSEPIFTGLKPETNYLFYCRKAENEYYYAGAISTALVVRTNEVPKCSENGAHLYDDACDEDCNYCGELRYDAHRYANACDATCEDCGKYRVPSQHIYSTPCDPACNICGAERIGSPHTYTNSCDKDCNICGAVREVVDHDYDNACDAICNVCGAYREPSDHVYSNACDIDCNVCGAYRIVGDHVYSNACDTSCNICHDIRDVPPHTYSGDCDTSCNECGEIRTAQNHTYSSDCDTSCNECGEIRTAGPHLYTNSCDSTCNECGEIREVIHSFGEYRYDNNATSLKDGTKTRTCTVCGEKDTVVVPGTKLEREIRDSSAIFSDVKLNDWFKPAVDFVFTHEIMFGTGDGTTFSPSGIMNRAMLVTMLYRLEGSPEVSGNHGFIDVGDNQWYTDAIIWASQNGIVSGKGGGRFAPTEALTRASFVSILYRYAEYCGEDVSARADLSAFADEANVPTWARANIEWAVAKGLLSGSTKNGALYINPTGIANRAQGATLLQKFCEM